MLFNAVSDYLLKMKVKKMIVIKEDSNHCCPAGYKCDMEKNKCEKGIFIPWFTSKKATPLQVQSKLILSSSLPTVQCSGLFLLLSFQRKFLFFISR